MHYECSLFCCCVWSKSCFKVRGDVPVIIQNLNVFRWRGDETPKKKVKDEKFINKKWQDKGQMSVGSYFRVFRVNVVKCMV